MSRFVSFGLSIGLAASLAAHPARAARGDDGPPRPWILVSGSSARPASLPAMIEGLEGAGLPIFHVIPQWDAVAGIWDESDVIRACEASGCVALSGDDGPAPAAPPGIDVRLPAIVRRWEEIRDAARRAAPGRSRDRFVAPHLRSRPALAPPAKGARGEEALPRGRFGSHALAPAPHRPFGAGPLDVSEFLEGDVALGVIFPSSDGSIDPDTEEWTPAELDMQVAGILEAMEFWATTFPGQLRFFYRFEGEVPTGYEPIDRPSDDDRLWFGDVLSTLGFSAGNPWRAAYMYVDALIRDLGTDWGGIYFSVDSSNDSDGLFADGFPDYTYFGGPMVITPSTHGGDGEEETPTYAAHEFAHLFYANDEYFWALEPCDTRSGYLGAPNQNSAFWNCRLAEECIMKTGYLPGTRACLVTGAQLGLYDRDTDGIPDLLDTTPGATIDGDSLLVFREGDPMIVTGDATVRPARNRNPYGSGHDITTNTIASVAGRIDGGPAKPAIAVDGAFDTGTEPYLLDLTGLAAGMHRLEITPANSVGNVGPPVPVDIRVDP